MRAAAVRTTARIVAGAGLLAPFLVGPGTGTAEAATGPNLVVKTATVTSTTVAEGDSLEVSYAAGNTGGRKARRSTTRFYLTRDWAASLEARRTGRTNPRSAPQDILLDGASTTAALPGGRTATVPGVEVTVPVGTQPGRYTLIACADDRGRVAEGDEADNCTPSGPQLTVTAPAGNGTLELQQFADTAPWPDEDQEEWDLEVVQSFCADTVSARPMSLTEAITSTRRRIQRAVGAEAMQALDASGRADDPVAAQELAAVAVTQGVPGLALAALLRAHDQEPRNATHLINAAGLAVSLGLPNQALGMLDGAVAGDLRRGAMGVSQQAIALVVRGEALLMTGQVRAAEGMFEAALESEPMLSEAEAGLAHVEACLGHDDAALDHLRSSRQRTQGRPDDTLQRSGLGGRPRPALDYDHGASTPLRKLPLATTPAQALTMQPLYDELFDQELYAELEKQVEEQLAIEERIRQGDDERSPAERQRRDSILGLIAAVPSEPEIQVMAHEVDIQLARIMKVSEDFFTYGPDGDNPTYTRLMDAAYAACEDSEVQNCYMVEMNARCRPALTKAHAAWTDLMTELQEMLDQQMEEVSFRMSAIAANLKDPDAHRLAMLSIEQYERDLYSYLAQQADFWSGVLPGVEEECVAPLPAEILPTDEAPPGQHQGPCTDEDKKKSWVAAFGNVKMKVSCEKVSFEGALETLPFLFAFAEMSVDRRTGKMTIFAGSKGEAKVAGVVEKGFKSGIYLTSDIRTGEITDVGMRAGQSLSLDGKIGEYQVYEDMVDISFVPVFTTSDE